MISSLHGIVRSLGSEKVVLEVGGVGLTVSVTAATTQQLHLGVPTHLYTSFMVREDSLTLFGFIDEESRDTFELVQTVTGIGPKVALAIMGAHTPSTLAAAIAGENVAAIEKVPGIGKKGAQRLILELKGKISFSAVSHSGTAHQPQWREQLTAALTSLGFTAKDSDGAISEAVQEFGSEPTAEDLPTLLKLALQSGRR